jgi:polysaccharide biosynthesis protein PslH
MKITMICHDIPYPPNYGARVDTWRRIKAFSEFGAVMQLVCWSGETPIPEDLLEINKYFCKVYIIPFDRSLFNSVRRVIDLLSYPLEVTSRILRGEQLSKVINEIRDFSPDVIWSDYVHCGDLAVKISKTLQRPLISRSHNIEHVYYRNLLESSIDWKGKLRRFFSVAHLEKYEKNILVNSSLFYDISIDDLRFWKNKGFSNGRYLPPFIEFSNKTQLNLKSNSLEYDIVFLGNLNTDNNVAAIFWFINQVLPIIKKKFPDVKVLIAGSRPAKKIEELCTSQQGVSLKVNPPDAASIYESGKVLINPMEKGSGVSIKSIEMLMSGRPIVTRLQGVAGIPEEVKKHFHIALDTESFAEKILTLLSNSPENYVPQQMLESLFGFQAIKAVFSDIESLLSSKQESKP